MRITGTRILLSRMIRGGFLGPESRKDLIELARDGSAAHAATASSVNHTVKLPR